MTRFIDADPLYEQIVEKEELVRQRVLDTPTHYDGRVNPTYIRYSAQADERTNMRKMVMDAPTIDAVPIEFIQKRIDQLKEMNGLIFEYESWELERLVRKWREENATAD